MKILKKVLVVALLLVALVVAYFYYFTTGDFDSAEWKAAKTKISERNHKEIYSRMGKIRCSMWRDLQASYLKSGMSKNEVEQLIGRGHQFDVVYENKETFFYSLGYCVWSHYTLTITYKNGRLASHSITPERLIAWQLGYWSL